MTSTLTPLVSLLFGGATLTEHDDLPPGAAHLGCPVWGELQLLADLELRLGLPQPHVAHAVRVQQWSRRLTELETASPGRFYARSHALDSVGTAETLLGWRDELVVAGWNGDAVPNGGDRLETLRQLAEGVELLPGRPDRLRRVEEELRVAVGAPFDALLLAEPRSLWPGRWQRIFTLLEECGTVVGVQNAAFEANAGDSDLACLQSVLRGEAVGSRRLRGDGSLVLLCAETSWELAEATAALLRAWEEPSTTIVRGGEVRPLDYALVKHGLASQGLDATSAWRPALQVLPLATELAFEPRDPYRMLEILTLPGGPFQGFVGGVLAGALAEAPGIGGRPWRQAKEFIAERTCAKVTSDAAAAGTSADDARREADERVASLLERIATWFEKPGLDASRPAPRAALLEVTDRVRTWLRERLAMAQADGPSDAVQTGVAGRADILASAFARAEEFHATLSHESRADLDLVDVRLLLEQVSSGHTLTLATEAVGRIDPVNSPAALRRARDVVVWWHCVGGTEWRPAVRPWRRAELGALHGAGVVLPDMAERLAAEGKSWHNPVLAARKLLVLAMPRWALGQALEPHPVWHEMAARLEADGAALASITIEARDLLAGRAKVLSGTAKPPVRDLGPLPLPPARGEWQLDPRHLGTSIQHSATSLEALVGCPLRWVFSYPARLHAGTLDSIASGPRLSGALGHRLVEELHLSGALATPAALGDAMVAIVDRLLREEAAVLLRPGMTFELAQLRGQLGRAVRSLAETLAESKLTVAGVEVVVEAPWRAGALHGRLDLLLSDESGRDVVLDLKWGALTYRQLLESGRATQLAIYAEARKRATSAREMPAAAYFSLSQGKVLGPAGGPFARGELIDGPPLAETWARLERTVDRVERTVLTGRVAVTGVRSARPLLETIGVGPGELDRHLGNERGAACKYCAYGALCGQKWEGLA